MAKWQYITGDRWAKACEHRLNAHLVETAIWEDPVALEEVKGGLCQSLLFGGATGGDSEMVANAIQNGANASQAFARSWRGALNGELVTAASEEPAYEWRKSLESKKDSVTISTPLQAAVAGGCPACIEAIVKAGGKFTETWDWVSQLGLNIPRAEAGIAMLEVCLKDQGLLADRRIAAQGWIRRAEAWGRSRASRKRCNEQEWGRLVQAYRRLYQLAEGYELKFDIPDVVLAELL